MASQHVQPIRIDFVSDISCPWCAIGLGALERAFQRLAGRLRVQLHFQPFELNPRLPPGGVEATTYLMRKYRIDAAQVERNRALIRQRAAEYGFAFNLGRGSRVYDTFDAHRLLAWADELGGRTVYDPASDPPPPQLRLKRGLLQAYFSAGADPSDHTVLVQLATAAGLDGERAAEILAGDDYATEVRAQQRFYASLGIRAVPAVILDHRQLIQGGQPPEVFEQALRQQVDGAAVIHHVPAASAA